MIHLFILCVIINNGNIMSIGILPAEYDSPLGVNSNAMKSFVITPQCFKPVAGRQTQKFSKKI